MTNTFSIYLLTRLTAIQGLFVGIAVTTAFIVIMSILYRYIEYDIDYDEHEPKIAKNKKITRNAFIVFSIGLCGAIVTPTTQEGMIIIAGGKTLDYVQKDTSLQKIPYKATELILHKMEEYMKEDKK